MKSNKTVINTRFYKMLSASVVMVLFSCITTLTDTIIAGNMIDEDAVSAVTLISPVIVFIAFIGYAITSGVTMASAFEQGKGNDEHASGIFSLGIMMLLISGILCTVLLYFCKDLILSIWDLSEGIRKLTDEYYKGFYAYPLILYTTLMMYSMTIAFGRDRILLQSSAVQAVSNILLSVILEKQLGIFGISIATTISMLIGCVIFTFHFAVKRIQISFRPFFSIHDFRKIIVFGINDTLDTLSLALLPFIISAYFISRFEDSHFVVFSVVINALNIITSIMTGLADSSEALMSLYYGENNYHALKEILHLGIKVAVIISVISCLVFIVFPVQTAALIGIKQGVNVSMASTALRITSSTLIIMCIEYYVYSFYGCIMHVEFSYVFFLLMLLVFPAGLMFIFGELYGITGIWIAIAVSPVICMILDIITVRRIEKKEGLGKTHRMLLSKKVFDSQLYYNVSGTTDDILSAVSSAAEDLKERDIADKISVKIQLLMEEMGMKSIERQQEAGSSADFQLQYTIFLDDPVRLIIRDNGVLSNDTEDAENLTHASLRSYVLSQAASSSHSRYLPTTERNRTVFVIKQ